MLVPLVWFEESALIPEESARKFKTLYTDRIRMVNIVLTTLFLAALALLAIDMRLLVNYYTSCFNIKLNCKVDSSCPSSTLSSTSTINNSPSESASNNSSPSSKANSATDSSQAPLNDKKKHSKSGNLRANLTRPLPVKVAAAMLNKSTSQNYHQHHKSLAEQEEADYLKLTRRLNGGQLNLPLLSNSNGNEQNNLTPAAHLSGSTMVTTDKINGKSLESNAKRRDILLIDNLSPKADSFSPTKLDNANHGQTNKLDSVDSDNNFYNRQNRI